MSEFSTSIFKIVSFAWPRIDRRPGTFICGVLQYVVEEFTSLFFGILQRDLDPLAAQLADDFVRFFDGLGFSLLLSLLEHVA